MNRNSNLFLIPYFFVIFVIVFAIVAGCVANFPTDQNNHNAPTVLPSQETATACPIILYGNGVMVFKCDETNFAMALSEYIVKNNVTVTAIAGVPDRNSYMRMIGYYVVVK